MIERAGLRVVTKRAPDLAELDDLHVRLARCEICQIECHRLRQGQGDARHRRRPDEPGGQQQDRRHEGQGRRPDRCNAAAMASDAFFPFRDGLDVVAEFGIKSVIQPGGSKRDAEVIAAADEHGIAMVFTGMRHFRH